MSIKDIVALVDQSSEAAGRYALSVASSFGAHLTLAAVITDASSILGPTAAAAAYASTVLEKAREAGRTVLKELAKEARTVGVTTETQLIEVAIGSVAGTLGSYLRGFDVILIQQPNPEIASDKSVIVESSLFGSGRPVLFVPYIEKGPLRLETVLIAWDGSAPASRAIRDALPFLLRAKRLQVVTVGDLGPTLENSSRRLSLHLQRHGLRPEFRLVSGSDVASALLSDAFDASADLLVMGGYGHSRFRELVLGGATHGILESMTLPVFMSH